MVAALDDGEAGDQFRRAEWLGHIVVRAVFQRRDLDVLLIADG